jgi:hypothetical protein
MAMDTRRMVFTDLAVRSLANKYDRAGKIGQPSHKHPARLVNFAPEST